MSEQFGTIELPDFLERPADDVATRHRMSIGDEVIGYLVIPFIRPAQRRQIQFFHLQHGSHDAF